MKKLYTLFAFLLLFAFIILFSACSNKAEFNENNVSAEEDSVFDNINSGLDYKNAGRILYNKNMQYGELLDISKEKDSEKYYVKYNTNIEYDFTDMPYALRALEFLEKGSTLNEAYKHIAVYYVNRDNLGIFNFNEYMLPYTENINNDNMSEVQNSYIKATEAARKINLSLLKARNMILYALNNQIKDSSDKVKAQAHLMIAISYLAQDRLYNILEIKKHAALWKELGGIDVDFLKSAENEQLTALLTYIAYNENTGVVELITDGIKKEFLQAAFSKGGIYNYLNDGFYIPVGIALRQSKYAVNPFYMQYETYKDTTSMMKIIISGKEIDENDKVADYKIQNNFDTIYDNEVFILPLNGAVYTIEVNDGSAVKVEFRNPAYFDAGYASYLYDETARQKGLPKILSEYEYNILQKDYIINDKGKLNIVWAGTIRNQMPDERKLFTFKGIIDCLNSKDNINKLEKICSSRENMIKAKYIHKNRCGTKKDCLITSSDIDL